MVMKCVTNCGQRIILSAQMVLHRTDGSALVSELCFKHSERLLTAQNRHPFCNVAVSAAKSRSSRREWFSLPHLQAQEKNQAQLEFVRVKRCHILYQLLRHLLHFTIIIKCVQFVLGNFRHINICSSVVELSPADAQARAVQSTDANTDCSLPGQSWLTTGTTEYFGNSVYF